MAPPVSATQREVFERVLDVLNSVGIQYMLVGSLASTYWGRPRTTHDADVVVAINAQEGDALAAALGDEFYAPDFVIRDAVEHGDQFNAVHFESGVKVDFWLLSSSAFDLDSFRTRRAGTLFRRTAWVSSPESVVLSKLRRHREAGGDTRQYLDALEVYEVQRPTLDEAYLDHWAERLGLTDLLQRVRDEAAEPQQ